MGQLRENLSLKGSAGCPTSRGRKVCSVLARIHTHIPGLHTVSGHSGHYIVRLLLEYVERTAHPVAIRF